MQTSSIRRMGASFMPTIDIDGLPLDEGALLIIRSALRDLSADNSLRITGGAPDWDVHLTAWCRQQGHPVQITSLPNGQLEAVVTRGPWAEGRWRNAMTAGDPEAGANDLPAAQADPLWGLATRGATVEAGSPRFAFRLRTRDEIWAATAGDLYRQALASQWDPQSAIDWDAPFDLPSNLEAAVAQVMTFLIENENAALIVPARHLGEVHPHYREVQQLLAIQCADEARHIEVFTRRLRLRGQAPSLSTAGGQLSLRTLLQAADFSTAALLLSVLGEGTFVNLLNFLAEHAPDPVTRQISSLAARDEARHVAFGMAHLEYRLGVQPDYLIRLQNAVEDRYEELKTTAGLNEEV
ncbi:MAG TPA: ferritin-like domain-containing protein, partial [Povalibacter sp.]